MPLDLGDFWYATVEFEGHIKGTRSQRAYSLIRGAHQRCGHRCGTRGRFANGRLESLKYWLLEHVQFSSADFIAGYHNVEGQVGRRYVFRVI